MVDDFGTRELSCWQGQDREALERDGIDTGTKVMFWEKNETIFLLKNYQQPR